MNIDLSKDLSDYLSRSEKQSQSGSGFNSTATKVKDWFSSQPLLGSNGEPSSPADENNGWLGSASKDPCLPSLGKKQRIVGFIFCNVMGAFCFILASLYFPMLLLKARKFALLYSLGSLFIISSFAILWGPVNHLKHLFAVERLTFTTVYFGCLFGTLYFSLWVKSTLLTAIFAIAQIIALLWYIMSYIPGGKTGMKFFTKVFTSAVTRTASKTLPV